MRKAFLTILISIFLAASLSAAPQAPIVADLDALLSSVYKADEPGAARLAGAPDAVIRLEQNGAATSPGGLASKRKTLRGRRSVFLLLGHPGPYLNS